MTRRDKCDACRKAKIKCDESLPQCLNCVRLGKACTRDQYTRAQFKFVEVKTGKPEVAKGHAGPLVMGSSQDALNAQRTLLRQRNPTVVVSQRHDTGTATGSRAASPIKSELSQADLFWPRSESSMLVARWASCAENYIEHVDSYGGWSAHVPRYLGRSEAVDKAARCFMECRRALANPTEANIGALRLSNVGAVRSIRQALESRGSHPCKGDILLAIQLLYVVEVTLIHNPSAFVIHVEGLIALLKAHKKGLDDSDDQEKLMSRVIFQSTFASGLVPAMFAGTNHSLDDQEWLTTPLLPRDIRGVSQTMTQQACTRVAHSFILIPRLARLVRLLRASAHEPDVEKEALELALHLFAHTVDAEFFREATASSELRLEQTVLPEIVDAAPMSYRFGSVRLSVLLSCYWSCRLLICGLIEALLAVSPDASLVLDGGAVHDEDGRVATDAVMAAQHTFMTVAAATDKTPHRGSEMRLLMLLNAAFGSWVRAESRQEASGTKMGKERLDRAARMKQLCLDMANRILVASHAAPMTETGLKVIINLYSGGPLVGT